MTKRKVIYSDLPRSYDQEVIKFWGRVFLLLFVLAVAALACHYL